MGKQILRNCLNFYVQPLFRESDKDTDRLHPNAEGHRRMALTLMYQLLALPASFR